MAKCKNIAGQKFGRLVALERVGKDKHGMSLWKCVCECGGTATVAINNLTTGHTLSCGCYKTEKNVEHGKNTGIDLIGQKFGQLTVIRKTEERICGQIVWECNRGLSPRNTSGYTGVSKTESGKWFSYIRKDNKLIRLGVYENIEDAISARREAEMKYFGEYTQ